MKLETMKKQYDSKTILEIEGQIEGARETVYDAMVRQIEMLYYLDRTKRFRENKRYKDSTFETYIKGRFNITPNAYHEKRLALGWYPKESKDLGIGTVMRIHRDCEDRDRVFGQIGKEQQARKTPLPQKKIEEIIQTHRRPKPARPQVAKPTKGEVERLRATIAEERATIRLQASQIDTLKATVQKQKVTIQELKQYKAEYEAIMERINSLLGDKPEEQRATSQA